MNRIAVWVALMLAFLVSGAFAQPSAAGSACPPSTTLDELTRALDDAVSGPRNKDRACLRDLMLPEARLTPIRKEQNGSFDPRILTLDDWINAVRSHAGAPFYEHQIKVNPKLTAISPICGAPTRSAPRRMAKRT